MVKRLSRRGVVYLNYESREIKMNSYLLFDPTISDVSTLLEGLNQNYLPIPIQRQTLFETINNIVSENETFELNILAHGAPGEYT